MKSIVKPVLFKHLELLRSTAQEFMFKEKQGNLIKTRLFKGHTLLLQRKYPGEGNGTPLQYSCLENPMDGGAW